MLEKIKKELFKEFNPEEKKGVFFSGFNATKDLIVSQGVCETDKSFAELLTLLYENHIEPILKETTYIVVDVVTELIELQDSNDIREMDPKEYGLVVVDLEDDTSGVLLPNTEGIADMRGALFAIKQKYGVHGKISIAVFRTQRTVFAK